MGKMDLSNGSKVYYQGNEYEVIKPVDFKTLTIQSVEDENHIIDVKIKELSAAPQKEQVQLDVYSDKAWAEAKKKYESIKELVFRKTTKAEVEEAGKQYGVSYKTIYEWIKMYEASGGKVSSLVSNRHKRGKKGSRLNSTVDKVIDDVLEELYLTKQRTGFPKIYNRIITECSKLDIDPPHANTVRNRIKALDPEYKTRRRQGHKAASEAFESFEGEYPEGDFPLEVYQVDHTPLDIIVVDPIFRKPLGRPYLTLAIDVYSRMVAGFYLSLQAPGFFSVSQCLLNAFLPKEDFLKEQGVEGEWEIYGIPSKYAVDNGKDLIGEDMQRVCDEFGMTMVRRPVGRPQFGAHVERVLGTINKEIHNLPGTTFSNVTQKGEYDSAKEASFTLEEISKWLTEFIVNVYHKRVHHGIGMTPQQKYWIGIFGDEENPGTGLPPVVEDVESIRIALMPTFYRTIQQNGITLDGITYYSDVLRTWINKRDEYDKKIKFKIKRDPMNIQKLYFYDPQLEEYFELNYRKLHAPKMTYWDLLAAKRYLKEKHISEYDESDIFDAYERLEEIEKTAKEKTKTQKLRKNKTPKMRDVEVKQKEPEEKSYAAHSKDDVFASLFDNIETFDISGDES